MQKKALIGVFILIGLAPLALSIGYAFFYSLGLVGLVSRGFTLGNWAGLFQGEFLQSILHSAWIAGV
ncbi:MAG: hypothetical protein ACNA78_11925, partial [Balneolaceae bacterium]